MIKHEIRWEYILVICIIDVYKRQDEILMSVRFQDLESGINYFRYMWIHASAVPGDAPQEVKDIGYPIGPGQGIIVASDEYRNCLLYTSSILILPMMNYSAI